MREKMYISLAGENAVVILNETQTEDHRIYVERPGRLRTLDFAVYGAFAEGIFALAPKTGELLFTVYAGAGACDIRLSSDGGRAYALCADADAVSMLEIDGRSGGLLQCMPTGGYPRSMDISSDETRLIVACAGSCSVMLLSADTLSLIGHRIVRGVPCYAVFCGGLPICASAIGEYRQEGRLTVFDQSLTSQFSETQIPGTPTSIYPLDEKAVVGYIGGLMCVNIKKNLIEWERPFGFPDAMCVSGDNLIVADLFENTIHILTLAGTTVSIISPGLEPSGIAIVH